jgi:predicted O-methyltransferase YrrM
MNIPTHGKYEWLPMLYNIVKHFKPNKIVEFGPGRGQTTVTMALALKELGKGKINSYDLWNDEYWGDKKACTNFFKECGVDDLIDLGHLDFYDWTKLSKVDKEFDLLYFDIDNNGDKLLDLYENVKQDIVNGSVVLFEGGSLERDNHGVGGRKMNDVKNEIGYEVLTDDIKYSFSIIYNKNLYNLGS